MVKISGEKIYQNSEISDEDALQARLLYGCPGRAEAYLLWHNESFLAIGYMLQLSLKD